MARKRFKTLDDLRRYLGGVLNRLESGKITEVAAKSRAYICNILAGVIKDGDIERRVEELEKALNKENVQ